MKYVGLILFVLGLGLMGLSYYTTMRVNQKSAEIHEETEHLDDDPLIILGGPVTEVPAQEMGTSANDQVEKKAQPYETMAAYEHLLGLILIVLGTAIALFYIAQKIF